MPNTLKKITLIVFALSSACINTIPSNAKNDGFPLFSTLEPHSFTYTQTKQQLHGFHTDEKPLDRFQFSISPFGQNADKGQDINNNEANLGNLSSPDGRKWAMLGLLNGNLPNNIVFAVESEKLEAARVALGINPLPINEQTVIDPAENFGFFDIPAIYKKRGIRFDMTMRILKGFGLSLQTGFSDICHTTTAFTNSTGTTELSPPGFANVTVANINRYLMNEFKTIMKELGLNIENFHKTSLEDVHLGLFLRHAFKINYEKDKHEWPHFLLIPFGKLTYIAAASRERKGNEAFSIPFGNNGHNAINFTSGINLDFKKTIEMGFEWGITHFLPKKFNKYRVPTSELQSGIFPFATSVRVSPGFSWHWGLKMNARHFVDKLSIYFQWVVLEHKDDNIEILDKDPAFLPDVLKKRSTWKSQVANIGLNYDISENISLGFFWQAPLSQRNSYRSTTVMVGINVIG